MWSFTALLLLPILLLTSCQQQNLVKPPAENLTGNTFHGQQLDTFTDNISAESGFEIPQGTIPQREQTYDDITNIPGGAIYVGNLHTVGEESGLNAVESTEVAVGDGFYVRYRDNIETEAGQIRYNIFATRLSRGDMRYHEVNLRLTNSLGDIQVKKVLYQQGMLFTKFVLMIEIPSQVKPGDYKIGSLIFINGKYYGDLPCTIHVIE